MYLYCIVLPRFRHLRNSSFSSLLTWWLVGPRLQLKLFSTLRLADDKPLTHHLAVRVEFQFMYICGYCNFSMFCAIGLKVVHEMWIFWFGVVMTVFVFQNGPAKFCAKLVFWALGNAQFGLYNEETQQYVANREERTQQLPTHREGLTHGPSMFSSHPNAITASCFFCFATLYWLKTAHKTAGRVGRDSCCVIVFLLWWLWVLGWCEPTLCRPFDLSLRGPCWPFPRVVVQKRTAWDSSQNPAENPKCLSNL